MDKFQIWEVLETCLLATDGADIGYLIEQGFNPELAKLGVQLCSYLKSKEISSSGEVKILKKNPFHSSPEPSK